MAPNKVNFNYSRVTIVQASGLKRDLEEIGVT